MRGDVTVNMSANANLHKAKDAKNDEFYTQLTDVSKELMHYKQHFKDKIVLCNCDDPTWSAFWKYFHLNFSALGLKKLISTHYDKNEPTYKMEYTGGNDNDIEVGVITPLEGNGDFRNQECLDLLDEADIVVTNPPFSLYREYVDTLISHQKQFLIIGNMNSVTCKEIFPLIRDGKMWVGVNEKGGTRKGNSLCFTVPDNYDAIDCNRSNEIPVDYDGCIGVPVSFLNGFYNPAQFELIERMASHGKVPKGIEGECGYINGKWCFSRILIRKKAGA